MTALHYEPKRIYIAERNPALTREQFVQRWRQHGALAMSFMARQNWDNVIRYVHCDAIHDHGIEGVSEHFDGMGIVRFRDPAARARHIGFAEARATLAADEEETFKAQMKFGLGNVTREAVLLEGPSTGVKMVYCSTLRNALRFGAVDYAVQRADDVRRIFEGALRRYAQSFPVMPENGQSWGLKADLIEELWFDDVAAAQAAYAGAAARAFQADTKGLADARIVLLTKELVLYPQSR